MLLLLLLLAFDIDSIFNCEYNTGRQAGRGQWQGAGGGCVN